ncbi:TPA: hypothetical protein CPT79_05550 [Candidatus Gastranaerophilales bacterium HUM_6]|nr:MAG TPA: hypothetical protein CPT79_05550 [Candidatus Gastranaerophilales bacterium HUM_6]DAA95128.1 MAG TPA: hypothetical protein CPT93_01140 [Candidatus Gastranaerophilales bacterium HUM_7]DAB02647.1 MAG TPA: hypothetical protein CPT84_04440 [Candidatus Gastranaerophilales bacterium HUM_12]DAB06290.1 MAG TPA: hypothetical protein CPT78_05225 [Candidatus Gastranaerophilales bacterium HUM_14]
MPVSLTEKIKSSNKLNFSMCLYGEPGVFFESFQFWRVVILLGKVAFVCEFEAKMQIIKRKKDNSKDKKRINWIFFILHFFRHGKRQQTPIILTISLIPYDYIFIKLSFYL